MGGFWREIREGRNDAIVLKCQKILNKKSKITKLFKNRREKIKPYLDLNKAALSWVESGSLCALS